MEFPEESFVGGEVTGLTQTDVLMAKGTNFGNEPAKLKVRFGATKCAVQKCAHTWFSCKISAEVSLSLSLSLS